MYIGLLVMYPLFMSELNKSLNLTYFLKYSHTRNFIKPHSVEAQIFHAARGRTDEHDENNSRFSQLCQLAS